MNVAILIFNDAEVLDFAGPFEVLNVADRVAEKNLFDVYVVAEKNEPVIARNGFTTLPDYSFENLPNIDILIVPGGPGRVEQSKNEILLKWLRSQSEKTQYLMSVCTGAFILAEAGLLNDHMAT